MTNGIENPMMFDQHPNTSRLQAPTSVQAQEELKPENEVSRRPKSRDMNRMEPPPQNAKPKINKNTEALLQQRDQRMQAKEEARL